MRRKVIMDIKQLSLLELLPEVIFGAEGEEGAEGNSTNSAENASGDANGNAGASSAPAENGDSHDDDEHDDRDDPKVKGLRSALASERKIARDSARELAKLRKEKEERELAEKTEIEQAQIREQKANEKVSRLVEGYRKSAIDRAIEKAASNFIDSEDALAGVDRSVIEVEQDDNDPSIIRIDQKSVERAVKALATKKPHFLKQGTDDGAPTGSNFGGARQKNGDVSREAALRSKYPSLAKG